MPRSTPASLRLCLISDTHDLHRELDMPPADILIHCGDVCMMDIRAHIRDFNTWLGEQSHRARIVVPGNHDDPVIGDPRFLSNATVLLNHGTRIDGLHSWGAGWSWPPNREWATILEDVDVLVTHVPPDATLDWAPVGNACGFVDLREAVKRIREGVKKTFRIRNRGTG